MLHYRWIFFWCLLCQLWIRSACVFTYNLEYVISCSSGFFGRDLATSDKVLSPQTIECVNFINNYFLKYLFAYNQVSVFINGCLRELPVRSGSVVERGYRYIKFLENVYDGFLFSLRHTSKQFQYFFRVLFTKDILFWYRYKA